MDDSTTTGSRFTVIADRSVMLISARSNVGPIEFGMSGLTGFVEVGITNGALDLGSRAAARVELPIAQLRSGNQLYDAELARRIDTRRFPVATLELTAGLQNLSSDRYQLEGVLTLHGVDRPVHGSVEASVGDGGRLTVQGEQVFDMRDFDVPIPTVLMLRIYPDVRVQLHVEAERAEATSPEP